MKCSELNLRRDSYHFLTAVPTRIGGKARIFVANGVGEKSVTLRAVSDSRYCRTWLVEDVKRALVVAQQAAQELPTARRS